MKLKGAVLCSAVLHMGFLTVKPPHGLFSARDIFRPPETYVLVEPVKALPKAAALKVPAPKPAPPARAAEPVRRAEPPRRVAPPKPVEQVRPALPPLPSKLPEPPPLRPAPSVSQAPAVVPAATADLPDGDFALIRHKEQVRAYLRHKLHFPEDWTQGAVRLRVTVLPDGTLKEAAVPEASDPRLAEIALRDARAAGPYPRFPAAMKVVEAEYEFLVQYSPDDRSR